MDKQLQLQIQSTAHSVLGTLRKRVAARAALAGDDPEIQPTRKETHDFDTASYRAYAAAFEPLTKLVAAAEAAIPAAHRFRGTDAASEARIAGLVQESLHLTPAGLGTLLDQTRADAAAGDEDAYALGERLLRVHGHGGRIDYAKVLVQNPAKISDRMVELGQQLAAHPAVKAREADLEWLENAKQEVNLLGKVIAAGGKPLETVETYLQTNSFPTILPPEPAR